MSDSLLKNLIDRVLRLADRAGDNSYRVRALDALDEAVQWYASRVPWEGLRRTEPFFADGSAYLTLPDRVAEIIDVIDATNSIPLKAGAHWEKRAPAQLVQETSGQAYEWRPAGLIPVLSQPATEAALVLTTSASDGMSIQIRGLVRDTAASGTALEFYEAKEEITMSGSPVSSVNLYTEVIEIQKDKATVADLLVTDGRTGLQVSRVPSWETRPMYRRIQLLYRPTAGTRMLVNYYRRPDRLKDEDSTIDPSIDEDALIRRAVGNMHWMNNEGQVAPTAWRKADELLEIRLNQERTHGEEWNSVQPWCGYFNQENSYWWEDGAN